MTAASLPRRTEMLGEVRVDRRDKVANEREAALDRGVDPVPERRSSATRAHHRAFVGDWQAALIGHQHLPGSIAAGAAPMHNTHYHLSPTAPIASPVVGAIDLGDHPSLIRGQREHFPTIFSGRRRCGRRSGLWRVVGLVRVC